MADLKPCPFCGGEARLYSHRNEHHRDNPSKVQCDKCGASTTVFYRRYKAIEAWNRRIEPAQGLEFDYGAEDD